MKRTDWDGYYEKPYKATKVSRRITFRYLSNLISKYLGKKQGIELVELGGANSCFYNSICDLYQPCKYIVIDNNQKGLDMLIKRVGFSDKVKTVNSDVLELRSKFQADLAFSVGLIEHFSTPNISRAISCHFEAVKPGGLVIISFPTPTFLYRITRKAAELLGLWIFWDETPLHISQVQDEIMKYGEVLETKVIWPIFLTQSIIASRKY